MTAPRIAFMGTPDFAATSLQALVDAGYDVVCVYSQPPRPAGRGHKLRPSPVHTLAEKLGIEVRTPLNFKSQEDLQAFSDLHVDMAVVAAYGLLLPKAILDAPKHGCLNIHASLLPRWRGAAPIHRAIMAGDKDTGITIMQMDEGLDTGDMLLIEKTAIQPTDTTGLLHDKLAVLGANAIVDALAHIFNNGLTPKPQPDDGVTYAKKIDKQEARINWALSATDIDRQVRALNPAPGAWFELDGQRVRVLDGHPQNGLSGPAGHTLTNTLLVACGDGAYQITRAQRAGKGAMDVDDFLRGVPVPQGTDLNP